VSIEIIDHFMPLLTLFPLSHSSVRSSGQILLPQYLMNGLVKLTGNIYCPFQMTWLYSGGQRSRSHVGLIMWGRRHSRRRWALKSQLT